MLSELLGESDRAWMTMASCRGIPADMANLFFDDYEDNRINAEQADAMCLACPVAAMCLLYGADTKSTGLWGGVYLKNGRPDKDRNGHKDEETWERLAEIHG